MPLILVRIPIASLIKTTATPGQLQLQFGKEVFEVGMSRALNTKTEAKPEVDLLEEVMGISLEEEEDQQSLEEEASNFSAVEEPLEFEKLGESLRPDPPKIELKQLPPGLKYAFLNRNRSLGEVQISAWVLTPRSEGNQSEPVHSSHPDEDRAPALTGTSTKTQ